MQSSPAVFFDGALEAVAKFLRNPADASFFAVLSPAAMNAVARQCSTLLPAAPILQCGRDKEGAQQRLDVKLETDRDIAKMTQALQFVSNFAPTAPYIELYIRHGSSALLVSKAIVTLTYGSHSRSSVPVRVAGLAFAFQPDLPATVASVITPRNPAAVTCSRNVAAVLGAVSTLSMTNVEDVRGTEQLSSLRNVALSFCHRVLSLASLRGKLPLVTHLSLVSVWIYDVDLAVVGTLAALESLVLRDIPHITTLAPLSARGCGGGNSPLPHLTRLETARCLSLVSVGGVELLAQLRSLSLALCSAIPVAASAQLLQHKCRPAGAADVAELDISGVTVALRPATADLAVHRATVLAGVRSLHWSGGRWAADGRLLATQMLNATLCPRLTALHIESLRPMNNEIAASIVEALPGLVTLKLGGRDEVRTLEFVKSAGPLLVELTVVFATPLHLDGAALDALLPREWSRLELRVHSPEAWAAAGVSARELMLHS